MSPEADGRIALAEKYPIGRGYRLAGAGGIEPPNGGIKIRCLTAWLRPISDEKDRGEAAPAAVGRTIAAVPRLINRPSTCPPHGLTS